MNKWAKRVLIAILACMLIGGVIPIGIITASAANTNIMITQSQTVAQIQTAIQNAINGSASSVTVIGSKTNVNNYITLNIPSNKTLIWKATYTSTTFVELLILDGGGTFEVDTGGILSTSGTSSGIYESVISSFSNNILITGGTVQVTGTYCSAIFSQNSIAVSGGSVQANGTGSRALYTHTGTIKVTGGTVSATGTGSATITALEAGAAAYLRGTCSGAFLGEGLIVEVDTLSIPITRNGTSTGLTKKAGAGTALWDCTSAKRVIKFTVEGIIGPLVIEWGLEVDFYLKTVDKTIKLNINWNDDVFSKSATVPNNDLQLASLVLSENVYRKDTVEKTLKALGFKDIELNYERESVNRVAHAIARKEIIINSEYYDVVAVVCRGTYGEDDYISNTQQFFGIPAFQQASTNVMENLASYVQRYGINNTTNIKYWITGHSRGGAVANLLSADITLNWNSPIMLNGSENNVYAYSFASPNSIPSVQATDRLNSSNISTLINDDDVVPRSSAGAKHGFVQWFYSDPGVRSTFKELTGISYNSTASSLNGALGLGFGHPHQLETYLSCLLQYREVMTSTRSGVKVVTVRCPVDVEVYDSSGVLAGRVVNNIVDDSIDTGINIWLEGDEKFFLLPSKEDYTFKMAGTDVGVMTYSVDCFNPDTWEMLEQKEFKNVALFDGKTMTSKVGDTITTPNVQLLVTNNEGTPIATVNTDGTEVPINQNSQKQYFKLWGKVTRWEKTLLNWFLLIACFGWIWMAF